MALTATRRRIPTCCACATNQALAVEPYQLRTSIAELARKRLKRLTVLTFLAVLITLPAILLRLTE
jgi:hypothetical protein